MAVELRDYQAAAIADLRAARAAEVRRQLLVAPTGAGKTTIAAALIAGAVAKGTPTIMLAHRTELIDQASARLTLFGLPHGIIKAGRPSTPGALVQVASVQSLARRDLPPARLVLVDEAHRTLGASYLRLLDGWADATVIGLTATPIRLDGQGLGDVYQGMVEAATIGELVGRGVLHRPRVFAPSTPDLAGVRTLGGDFNKLQLAEAMDKPHLVGDVVETWLRLAGGSRTVVFAASVAHSLSLRDAFATAGVAAEHLDGTTNEAERAAILARLEAGALRVVTNYGILTEGWDCPAVAVCVLARPTKSLGLYLQMVGRVLRTAPGKAGALVLDHAGATLTHGLVTEDRPWSLSASRQREAAAPAVRQCLVCYAIAAAGETGCPECGAAFPRVYRAAAAAPKTRAGELRELTEEAIAKRAGPRKTAGDWRREFPFVRGPAAQLEAAATMYATLKVYGGERGYKPTWAAWMFNEVAGCWPSKEVRAASRGEVAG